MRLSPHFTLAEFTRSDTAKQKGISNTPTPEHLANLRVTAMGMEWVRKALGRPVSISSGYRNPAVNKAVGGVATSDHALGYAADFKATATDAKKIVDAGVVFDQLIHEVSRGILHISFNPRMRMMLLTQVGGPGTPFTSGIRW